MLVENSSANYPIMRKNQSQLLSTQMLQRDRSPEIRWSFAAEPVLLRCFDLLESQVLGESWQDNVVDAAYSGLIIFQHIEDSTVKKAAFCMGYWAKLVI